MTRGIDSASSRNEYQGCFLEVKAAAPRADNLATFIADYQTILGASPSWNNKALSRPAQG
jgi:hypothetical protein